MSKRTLAVRSAIVVSIVAALLIPAAALALPGEGALRRNEPDASPARALVVRAAASQAHGSGASASGQQKAAARGGQPQANLERRISNVLDARKRRFDAASKSIEARLGRVSALADKVEAAGGDVTAARAYLDEAEEALAVAAALEQDTATELKGVSAAQNKKAALSGAKASGRKAVAQLKLARSNVVLAIQELRGVVQALEQSGAGDQS